MTAITSSPPCRPQDEYLAPNLQDNKTSTAIEDALREITGRILAFRLIQGQTLADWEREKANEAAAQAGPVSQPASATHHTLTGKAAPPPVQSSVNSERTVSATWEKLSERLNHGYKTAPFIKYPHGQAQYVLSAVKLISDTMDLQMPPPGAARDDLQERALAKVIERLGSVVNLDPLFLSLELLRFRESQGRNQDIAL